MRFLTTASYYGTGSSAVTDLLSEYSDVASLPSCFECRIAHDMFGLSDLEYYLVDNYHRHNSSVAVKMFERLLKLYGLDECLKMENYPYYLGPDFKRYCEEYIKRLAPLSYEGGSHLDIYMKSDAFIIWLKIKERIFRRIFHGSVRNHAASIRYVAGMGEVSKGRFGHERISFAVFRYFTKTPLAQGQSARLDLAYRTCGSGNCRA